MGTRRRFLAFAAGLTFLVTALAGGLGAFSLFQVPLFGHFRYISPEMSGPAPVLAHQFISSLLLVIAGLYVLLPVGIAWYYVRHGARHPLYYGVFATVAILGLPGLGLLTVLFGTVTANETTFLAAFAAVVLALVLAFRYALARGPEAPEEGVPWAVFANVGLVAVCLVGVTVGTAVGGATAGLVEQRSMSAPQVAFEINYTSTGGNASEGVLTIRHVGGDTVCPSRIYLDGEGFATVEGVDQVRPGVWRGETSTAAGAENQSVVAPGDAVRVGVANDCRVRVVYRYGDTGAVLDEFRCP